MIVVVGVDRYPAPHEVLSEFACLQIVDVCSGESLAAILPEAGGRGKQPV